MPVFLYIRSRRTTLPAGDILALAACFSTHQVKQFVYARGLPARRLAEDKSLLGCRFVQVGGVDVEAGGDVY
jgi:hypothetical protein